MVSDSDDSDDDGVEFDFDKLGPLEINPAEHKLQVSGEVVRLIEAYRLILYRLFSTPTACGMARRDRPS